MAKKSIINNKYNIKIQIISLYSCLMHLIYVQKLTLWIIYYSKKS